jgi:predicted SprT family Zn-dependent metalloprotease
MNHYHLLDWKLRLDRSVKRFGQTRYHSKEISLSRILIALNTWECVKMTVLHEIAHALCDWNVGHSNKWREACLAIGGDGRATYDTVSNGERRTVIVPEYRYHFICYNHGLLCKVVRRPQNNHLCRKCGLRLQIKDSKTGEDVVIRPISIIG